VEGSQPFTPLCMHVYSWEEGTKGILRNLEEREFLSKY
jgi:hypothetical protein